MQGEKQMVKTLCEIKMPNGGDMTFYIETCFYHSSTMKIVLEL